MYKILFDELEPVMLTTCLDSLAKHSGEHFYSVALYTCSEYSYLYDSLATIEGLESAAHKYLAKEDFKQQWQTITVAMRELKWSPADSPYHCELEDNFQRVNQIIEEIWENTNRYSDEECRHTCEGIYDTCIAVLASVRSSGIFEGHDVVFNILMGDQSDDERLVNAAALNSIAVVKTFSRELNIDPETLLELGLDLN